MGNRNFAVGLFVAIALAAFTFTTIWLTGNRGTEPTVQYSMYFETDVSGLMVGGPVFYLGVEVGTVWAMTIIPGDPMRIRVDAEVLRTAPIDSGTYASLALQGITGVAVIRLNAEPGKHEPLLEVKDEANLVIAVRDTGFSALLSKAPGIIEKLDNVLVQVNQILGEENRESVAKILADLATVSDTLASRQEAIGDIPITLNNAMTELHASLLTIKSMAGDFEPELMAAMANIGRLTDDLAKVSARLEEWTAANDGDMNAFMEDGLGQVPALVSDARNTLREIEKLVKQLREDPSALIYQPRQDAVDVEQ
jgi:phospholipid/cholesterol/gamma-HCH transport system substrate-binding protein